MVYLPILDILKSYLAIEEGDREFVIKKKLQGKLLQLDEQFKIHLPPLQELLSLQIDDEKYPQLDHGQKNLKPPNLGHLQMDIAKIHRTENYQFICSPNRTCSFRPLALQM